MKIFRLISAPNWRDAVGEVFLIVVGDTLNVKDGDGMMVRPVVFIY